MTSKELFQHDKDLRDKWHAVIHSDWFAKVLVFARSELMQGGLSNEQLTGAQLFERTILELPEDAPAMKDPITSGLTHNLEITKTHKPKTKK